MMCPNIYYNYETTAAGNLKEITELDLSLFTALGIKGVLIYLHDFLPFI